MKIVISEYAPDRALAFRQWLPDAQIVQRHLGEKLPDKFDVWVLGGGPQSVAGGLVDAQYPYLIEDMEGLRSLQTSSYRIRVIGVCLGAQMIAKSFGGRVGRGEWVLGWQPVRLITTDHSPFAGFECGAHLFQFHRDHITTLPAGAQRCALSSNDEIEAYTMHLGSVNVLATVFHPEVTTDDAVRIYKASSASLAEHERHREAFEVTHASTYSFSERFFQLVTAPL